MCSHPPPRAQADRVRAPLSLKKGKVGLLSVGYFIGGGVVKFIWVTFFKILLKHTVNEIMQCSFNRKTICICLQNMKYFLPPFSVEIL